MRDAALRTVRRSDMVEGSTATHDEKGGMLVRARQGLLKELKSQQAVKDIHAYHLAANYVGPRALTWTSLQRAPHRRCTRAGRVESGL